METENRQFKMLSLFDGSGGFPLAATLCGIEPVYAAEIEPFPIKVTKARFPHMKHLGDISKINGAELETVDVVTGGTPCFIAGTLIQTDKGLLPIENVKISDMVLTHTNTYQKVEKIGNQPSNNIIKIKLMGSPVITTTENHPFYVRKSKKDYSYYIDENGDKKRHNNKGMLEPEWLQAKDLKKGYYVGFSINKENKNPKGLTECECYLIGRYIADGYINESHRPHRKNSYNHKVIYCIGKGKLDNFKKNVTEYHVCAKTDKTVTKCEIISQRLVDLCKECGRGAINKTIPQFVMDLPPNLLEKVIDGYMSGDGCFSVNYKATTISKTLAYQLQQAVAKVYGTYAKVYFSKRPSTHIIEGRIVNQHDTYIVQFQKKTRKQDKYIYQDGMLWIPFVESETIEATETVYNMQVANDNSYTAYNFTVHNCQDMSVAGKRQGMSKKCPNCDYSVVGNEDIKECPECGTELEYTRSGLFMEQIRIIKEMREKDELGQLRSGRADKHIRPRIMLWENVVGAFSSNKGEDFRAVLEETARIVDKTAVIPRPKNGKWATEGCIMGNGYSIAWRVLDSQHWGVPQRRRRIALVGDFGGQCAGEILFKRKGLSRNFTESRKAWQSLTGYITESVGETGKYGINIPYDMTHANDVIREYKDGICPTLQHRMGTGGNQVPLTVQKIFSMNERQHACTITEGIANTRTGTDYKGTQCLFEPKKAYNIGAYNSKGMLSDNPHSGIYEDVSFTLNTTDRHAVCYGIDQQGGKGGANYTINVAPTMCADSHGTPHAVCYQKTVGTLNTTDRHAVAYRNSGFAEYVSSSSTLKAAGGDLGGGSETLIAEKRTMCMETFHCVVEDEKTPTLKARDYKDPHIVCTYQDKTGCMMASGYEKLGTQEIMNDMFVANEYIVRRLTPLECSRLQGFPDWWVDNIAIENPTEEDLVFWREVFETHRKIVTGAEKPKTDKQIIKWLKEPDTDGAKYKLWGNGIALPCFWYVMEGIKEILDRTSTDTHETHLN